MAEFFVDRHPLADGGRNVHRNTCSQLPAVETLQYLGSYASNQAALTLATGYYHGVSGCPACIANK